MRAALVAVAFLVAAAAALGAGVRTTGYATLAAEVVDVGSSFALLPGGVAVSTLGVAPAGASADAAVELAAALATASPGVAAGNHAYTATLREAAAGALAGGTYAAELRVDGTSAGKVYVRQGVSDLLAVEGTTLVWDVGRAAPTGASAYELVVTAV